MFDKIKKFLMGTWVNGAAVTRKDDFVWMVAEALMWRDESPSLGAIPLPVKGQPSGERYYEDALYVIRHVQQQLAEATEVENARRAKSERRSSSLNRR